MAKENKMILIKENQELHGSYLFTGEQIFNRITSSFKPLYEKIGIGPFNNEVWQLICTSPGDNGIQQYIFRKIQEQNTGLPSAVTDLVVAEKGAAIRDFAFEVTERFGFFSRSVGTSRGHIFPIKLIEIDDEGTPFLSGENKEEIMEKYCRQYVPKDFHDTIFPVLDEFAKWYNEKYIPTLDQFPGKYELNDLFELFRFKDDGALEVDPDSLSHIHLMQSYRD